MLCCLGGLEGDSVSLLALHLPPRLPVPLWFLQHKHFLIINYLQSFLELVSFPGTISLTSCHCLYGACTHWLGDISSLDFGPFGSNNIWFNTSCFSHHHFLSSQLISDIIITTQHLKHRVQLWHSGERPLQRPTVCINWNNLLPDNTYVPLHLLLRSRQHGTFFNAQVSGKTDCRQTCL